MKTILNLLLIFFVLSISVKAQGGGSVGVSDAISAGMGNTYVTNSRGVYAIGRNPANLMFSPDYHFEIATVLLPNLSFFAGTNFISLKDYNYYFGGVEGENGEIVGRYLNEQDKANLKSIFEDGGKVTSGLSTTYFSVVYKVNPEIGAIGFCINDNAGEQFDFPAGIIDLVLDGNKVGEVYDFNGSSLKASWLRDYSLSYARDFTDLFLGTFKKFSAGLTLKYIQGFAYIETDHIKTEILTLDNNEISAAGNVLGYASFSKDLNIEYDFDTNAVRKDYKFSPFLSPAGKGFGFDIGFSAQLDEVWIVGISVTDIGKVKWTKNVAEYSSDAAIVFKDLTDQEPRDSILNLVTGEGKYIDDVSSSLPTSLRAGISFQLDETVDEFPGTMVIAIDYNQGFNNAVRNSTKARFSLGVEWRPAEVVPIRTGFSFGGRDEIAWSFGSGVDLGLFEFNIAAFHFGNWLTASEARKFTVAIGSRWKF